MDKLKILLACPEVVPFAKTGGLADVAGALPKALHVLEHDARVIMPYYSRLMPRRAEAVPPEGTVLQRVRSMRRQASGRMTIHTVVISSSLTVRVGDRMYSARLLEGRFPGTRIPVYFVDAPYFFDRDGLYQENGVDYDDNVERFAFFSKAALETLRIIGWRPHVVHCNEWQTALIPAHLRTTYSEDEFFRGMATLFAIHNIGYQGIFPAEKFHLTGLHPGLFNMEGLEFFGQTNVLKAGLVFGDVLCTVSPTYSQEIQTPEFGYGLEGLLRKRQVDLYGVLNGIDYSVWNPAVDQHIEQNYDPTDMTGKLACKRALQKKLDLPRTDCPVFGVISRLADHKGLDLIAAIMDRFLDMDVQFVLLGTGDQKYHFVFEEIGRRHPRKTGITVGFDDTLAHQIEAGADFLLMPSRYEPCGLNQLYSLKYGTVPIVRRTGGLADSIQDATPVSITTGDGTGFVFDDPTPEALLEAIERAVAAYNDFETWQKVQMNGMKMDFSWHSAAGEYVKLYEKAIRKQARPG
jgi:starch synthase